MFQLYPKIETSLPGHVSIPFSFAPNGTSAIDQTSIKGLNVISSVTWSATGLYDVVFRDTYDALVIFVPAVPELATDADTTISSYLWTPSTRTLRLRVRSGGAAADVAANAHNRLGGIAVFKRTSLKY